MNTNFTQLGATVLVQDDRNNIRKIDNCTNIEAILLLENDQDRLNNFLDNLNDRKENLKKDTRKCYLKNHKTFGCAVIGVIAASTIGKALIHNIDPNVNMSIPFSPFGAFASIVMLLAKEESYYKFKLEKEKIDNEKAKNETYIKNLKILKFSLARELKLERNANLSNFKKAAPKKIYNSGLVDFDILDYYYENHDEIIDSYKKNGTIPYYNKDEFNTRLLSTMIQKELHDEEYNKNNISLKDKLKVKIKNKVDKLLG